ncbi:MAG: class I SAM-dependent methyltransferase [Candidatus Binatia bacterium]
MKRRLPWGYSLLAPGYDVAARVGSLGAIPQAQGALLRLLPPIYNLLIVGGGSGLCLRFLPWERVTGRVTFVDIAPGMMQRARHVAQALGVAERIQFLQQSVEHLDPRQRFDAVYTAFFLDQFPQPRCEAIMRLLHAALCPGGVWLDVDFSCNVEDGWARLYRAALLPFLYRFFRLVCGIEAVTLPNPQIFWQAQQYIARGKISYARASIEGCLLEKPYLTGIEENFAEKGGDDGLQLGSGAVLHSAPCQTLPHNLSKAHQKVKPRNRCWISLPLS